MIEARAVSAAPTSAVTAFERPVVRRRRGLAWLGNRNLQSVKTSPLQVVYDLTHSKGFGVPIAHKALGGYKPPRINEQVSKLFLIHC